MGIKSGYFKERLHVDLTEGRCDRRTLSDEFIENTLSVWNIQPESAKKVGHPAPFPIELPFRLIQLYSFQGDIVIDPFCRSGSTNIAAEKLKRKHIGIDIQPNYVKHANKRLNEFIIKMMTEIPKTIMIIYFRRMGEFSLF